MKDKNALIPIDETGITNLIYTIRGKQVMLDSDLAGLYQVETKYLNRQRSRNADRFPEDFCFQLTKEEYEVLRCQNVTSKMKKVRVVEDICRICSLNKELRCFLRFLKVTSQRK